MSNQEMSQDAKGYLGDPAVLDFMRVRLELPMTHQGNYQPEVFPMKNSIMLFGKKGAGKRTLAEQYYGHFDQVDGFVLQEYNLGDFCSWCEKMTRLLMNAEKGAKHLILVENVHLMAYCKGTVPEQQMMKLMTHIRTRSRMYGEPVFLVTTCSEGPLRINDTLVQLIDYMCYVPPPSDSHRMILFTRFLGNWVSMAQKQECYANVTYEVTLEDLELLKLVSKNTVPGDIWKFCQRCADAIPFPNEVCALDGELIGKLLYQTNKGKSIIQGVPEDELQMFAMYIEGSTKRGPPEEGKGGPSAAEALKARAARMSKKQKIGDKGKEEAEVPSEEEENMDVEEDQEGLVVGSPEWPPVQGIQSWVQESSKRSAQEEDWEDFEAECRHELKRQREDVTI